MRLPSSLNRRLAGIVGSRHVITGADRLLAYESDGLTAYRSSPMAVVLPASTGEVAAVVATLHEEGIPVVPRGAGTGLSGGALAKADAVIVGTARLNRILAIDVENRLARVQPGVVNGALSEAVQRFGLSYAPDPSSKSACTLGGNVAENSGGPPLPQVRGHVPLCARLGGGRVRKVASCVWVGSVTIPFRLSTLLGCSWGRRVASAWRPR